MYKLGALSLLIAYGLFQCTPTPESAPAAGQDVTSRLETLGTPFSDKSAYARNVWDMQVFDGKVYLGHGNSSNTGPSPNAGPVPICYYDPASSQFYTQNVSSVNPGTHESEMKPYVDEEQIDGYKILDGQLVIPGHDARGEGWEYGNYYKLEDGKWSKFRSIPKGVHVYDMASYKGRLFASVGTDWDPDVWMSEDNGTTWTKAGSIQAFGPPRAYTLFEFKDKLYAAGSMVLLAQNSKNSAWADETRLLTIDGENGGVHHRITTGQTPVYISKMFPGLTNNNKEEPSYLRMARTTVVKDHLLYIAGETYNDQQWLPRALFVADDLNEAHRVVFPEANALPVDLLVRDNTIYVLAYEKLPSGGYINRVYRASATNLDQEKSWTELFEFKQPAYARSFEELNGDFYFGLGSDTDPTPEATGTILRVKREFAVSK